MRKVRVKTEGSFLKFLDPLPAGVEVKLNGEVWFTQNTPPLVIGRHSPDAEKWLIKVGYYDPTLKIIFWQEEGVAETEVEVVD